VKREEQVFVVVQREPGGDDLGAVEASSGRCSPARGSLVPVAPSRLGYKAGTVLARSTEPETNVNPI
jgi:hypothetical protein